MDDGILLKFKDRLLINVTSCWSVFTDNDTKLTLKFGNNKFNRSAFKEKISDKLVFCEIIRFE